jgi:phosphonate dehydrogenase
MTAHPTTKPKVVIGHWVHPETVRLLESACHVVMHPDRDTCMSREEVVSRHGDAAALMAFMTDWVDDALLQVLPGLRIVAGALKGPDNLNAAGCAQRGVWVTVVPDLLTVPTAELTLALLLGLARQIAPADAYVRSGAFVGWRPRFFGSLLAGSTVGILGMGVIGRALAARLKAFEAHVLYVDPRPLSAVDEHALGAERVDLTALQARSDTVILLVHLLPETDSLVDTAFLRRMKPGALLINPARGSIVDEEAIAAALTDGRLGGYAADTFAFEDWARSDRPTGIAPALLAQRDRTLFTPHLGSAVDRVRQDITLAAARSILQALAGQRPDGAINEPQRRQDS